MTVRLRRSASTVCLRPLAAAQRIGALADPGSVEPASPELDAPRPSPHLARWGIAAQDDDGIVAARASIDGTNVLIAAQDERFLGGSAGANHGDALRRVFELAAAERPAAVVLLAASGGVRLHEANAAEWALARALSALLEVRASGIPVLVIGSADVFGGTSVLACAAERVSLLPGVRLGLSGPAVIEATRGKSELDAGDKSAVATIFGADARAAAGHVERLPDKPGAVREWIARAVRDSMPFATWLRGMHDELGKRLAASSDTRSSDPAQVSGRPAPLPANVASLFASARPIDPAGWLARLEERPVWLCRPVGAGMFGPREAHALDAALLDHVAAAESPGSQTLLLIGDSRGHEVSRRAEALCVSQYLAHHAAVLALLRAHGVRLHGLLAGIGHSAEFFANVLQATKLHALAHARVVAMEPAAVARVTRLPEADLKALIENDPLLGQPVRHFAAIAGMDIVLDADVSALGLVGLGGGESPALR
jgi:malonate decarboxylase beta subunit